MTGQSAENDVPDRCRDGHPFVPGVSTDHAPGESDPRWCNTCGETRPIPPAADQGASDV